MEKTKLSLVEWILSRPEGKQFLSAALLTVLALVTCIVFMEVRHDRDVDKRERCEQEKGQIIKVSNERLLDFLLKANENSEKTKEKYDSLSTEIIKLMKK